MTLVKSHQTTKFQKKIITICSFFFFETTQFRCNGKYRGVGLGEEFKFAGR